VSIVTDRRRDVLAVPNTALRFRPEGASAGAAPTTGTAQAGEADRRRRNGKDGETDDDSSTPAMIKRTVYVLVGGTPARREIITGLTDGRVTEVTGGELKEGESVIVGVAGQNNGQRGGPQQRGPRIL
jgi:HlyD family secretion protein